MNRELIQKSFQLFHYGLRSMDTCMDDIEAEFNREHSELIDKIAELERERGEIVGWINIPATSLKNDILEVVYREKKYAEAHKNPVLGHCTTVPIRLPKKEESFCIEEEGIPIEVFDQLWKKSMMQIVKELEKRVDHLESIV